MPDCGVHRQLIELLSVRAPSTDKKLTLPKQIVEEHGVDWDPAASEIELFKSHEDLNFVKTLLDVADNLDRASLVVKEIFAKTDESQDAAGVVRLFKTLLEGVEMAEKQLNEVLGNLEWRNMIQPISNLIRTDIMRCFQACWNHCGCSKGQSIASGGTEILRQY